jgi:uncharacterized protein (DUF2384 family)
MPTGGPRAAAFERVLLEAMKQWPEPAARIWMESPNGHLNGARPADALAVWGEAEVLDALEAPRSGAYA